MLKAPTRARWLKILPRWVVSSFLLVACSFDAQELPPRDCFPSYCAPDAGDDAARAQYLICREYCRELCGNGTIDHAWERCDDGNGELGDACPDGPGGFCHPARCGDGFVWQGVEGCDDANGDDFDGCRNDCTPGACGDGVLRSDIDPSSGGFFEECEEIGSQSSACDPLTCKLIGGGAAVCGDGIWQQGEQCEDDNIARGDNSGPCVAGCAWARCGDGFVRAGDEGCDDGNGILADDCPDGALGSCQPAVCGDGFVNSGGTSTEACEPPGSDSSALCRSDCTVNSFCGNAIVEADLGEQCDAGGGNSSVADGACRQDCQLARCGDFAIDYSLGEQCDDGNARDDDGCSATCMVEAGAGCGDGLLSAADRELCDDGRQCSDGTACTASADLCAAIGDASCLPRAGDGCSATCQYERLGLRCGDGAIDVGEICDDGAQCADGSLCVSDSDCGGITMPAGATDTRCLPRNGDGCNTTCSSTNQLDTFFIGSGNVLTMNADNRYLWLAGEGSGVLQRIDIAACLAHLEQNPCGYDANGLVNCPNPCPAPAVVNSGNNLSFPTSDGRTVWFGDAVYNIDSRINALDIDACQRALDAGAADCNAQVSLVAGGAWAAATRIARDGIGSAAGFGDSRGLTYYGGYLYLLDNSCGTLRRIDPNTRQVTTVAGDPGCNGGTGGGSAQEGYGLSARLSSPRYMASDNSGSLYVSDNFAHALYRYNTLSGYFERFVGDGTLGSSDALDGLTGAQFARPRDIVSDGTSLFVADFDNRLVRQVDLQTRRVSTVAGQRGGCGWGTGSGTAVALGKTWTMAYHQPSGSLFVLSGDTCPGSAVATSQILRIH